MAHVAHEELGGDARCELPGHDGVAEVVGAEFTIRYATSVRTPEGAGWDPAVGVVAHRCVLDFDRHNLRR